jgi:hypothetical protein
MTALDPARFDQALEIVMHEKLCAHEAGHAAAALLLGLDVQHARAGRHTLEEMKHGNPDEAAGEVMIRGIATPESHMALAVVTLAGPLHEGRAYWPPKWPLSSVPMVPDEADIGEAVKRLGLDERGYTHSPGRH